ncbi:MAG: GNAT family N-acetyltransferase [Anaerolineales bacterium]|nr:GNAT family N-acetyltransferase [Anaerolineales bacterium]
MQMVNLDVTFATLNERQQLLEWFQHYENKTAIEKRVDCFLSHGFTVIAKDKAKIVGVLQWYVKEDPRSGMAEFEEVYVLKDYRGKGIASALVQFAIRSVKEYFLSLQMQPRCIFLFTSRTEKAARALFEKYGFEKVVDVDSLFSDDDAESLYMLRLSLEERLSGVDV